jgi:hypothetical protein
VERKTIFRKKAWTRKVTAGRKSNTRACMEDLTTIGLGFWQCIVTTSDPRMYKYRYLGIIGRVKGRRGEYEATDAM